MVGRVRHTAVSMQPWISLRRSIARAIAKHLYRTVGSRLFAGDLNVQQLEVRSAVSQPGSGPGPQCGQRRIPAFSLGFNCLSSLGAGGWAGGQGQAEGCVLESFRAPPRLPTGGAQALKHQQTSLPSAPPDPMGAAVFMGPSPGSPRQLEYMDTAINATVSTGFSLSVQISKLGIA